MFDVNTRPNQMTNAEALAELSHTNGVTIGTLDGEPTIFFSSNFVKALEIARHVLAQPDRKMTHKNKVNELTVSMDRQCGACGEYCGDADKYCPNCGCKFYEED